jgi:hypothetical protein
VVLARIYFGQNDMAQISFGLFLGIALSFVVTDLFWTFVYKNSKEIDRDYLNKYPIDSSDDNDVGNPKPFVNMRHVERRRMEAQMGNNIFIGSFFAFLIGTATVLYLINLAKFTEPTEWASNMCSSITDN